MPEHMVTSADYGYWPIEVREWLDELGWLEVDFISFSREILPDGYVLDEREQRWATWKHGSHITVTARRGSEWRQQRFRLDGASWYRVPELYAIREPREEQRA